MRAVDLFMILSTLNYSQDNYSFQSVIFPRYEYFRNRPGGASGVAQSCRSVRPNPVGGGGRSVNCYSRVGVSSGFRNQPDAVGVGVSVNYCGLLQAGSARVAR